MTPNSNHGKMKSPKTPNNWEINPETEKYLYLVPKMYQNGEYSKDELKDIVLSVLNGEITLNGRAALTEKGARRVHMKYIDGLSLNEIAEKEGVSSVAPQMMLYSQKVSEVLRDHLGRPKVAVKKQIKKTIKVESHQSEFQEKVGQLLGIENLNIPTELKVAVESTQLNEQQQSYIYLNRVANLSSEQIAEKLNVTNQSVSVSLISINREINEIINPDLDRWKNLIPKEYLGVYSDDFNKKVLKDIMLGGKMARGKRVLPGKWGERLCAFYLEGKTVKQIAKSEGLTTATSIVQGKMRNTAKLMEAVREFFKKAVGR